MLFPVSEYPGVNVEDKIKLRTPLSTLQTYRKARIILPSPPGRGRCCRRARAAKLAAWYDGFIPYEGCQYKGQQVQAEAIADMAGVKCILGIAARKENFDYDAFYRHFAVTYRLKLPLNVLVKNSGDVHPVDYMRVNATLAQYDEFVSFYGIQPGDGMYIAPEDRVAVW